MIPNLLSFMELLRIRQWVKNAFILFPLIFSGQLYKVEAMKGSLLAFVGFCFLASSLYILNDFLDRKRDRLHPKKSQRPLAQKNLNPVAVAVFMVGMMSLGLWFSFEVGTAVFYSALIYMFLHLIYNFYAKDVVIVDVVFVAAGFQVRIWAGSLAVGVFPSVWLQLCVFLLALFLGFTKRRSEMITLKDQAASHRGVLAHYTTYLLDQIIIICCTLSIVFYGLYAISPEIMTRMGSHNMVYSIVFVIYGMFRYLYLVHVRKLGDDPGEVIVSDKPLLFNILLWVLFIIRLLYV